MRLLLALLLVFLGCSAPSSLPALPEPGDGAVDAPAEASADAAPEAASDVPADAPAQPDVAALDASPEASADAAGDAGREEDVAALDVAADAAPEAASDVPADTPEADPLAARPSALSVTVRAGAEVWTMPRASMCRASGQGSGILVDFGAEFVVDPTVSTVAAVVTGQLRPGGASALFIGTESRVGSAVTVAARAYSSDVPRMNATARVSLPRGDYTVIVQGCPVR